MYKNLTILLTAILFFFVITLVLYIMSQEQEKKIRKSEKKKKLVGYIPYSDFELEILNHYYKMGYTYIEPRKFGGSGGCYLCDGVRLYGNGLQDVIMDRPFKLFASVTSKESIRDLIDGSNHSSFE